MEKKESSIISTVIGFIIFIFFFIFFMPFISFFMMLSAFVGIIIIIIFFIVFFIFFKKIEKSIKEQLKSAQSDFEREDVVEAELDEKTKIFTPRASRKISPSGFGNFFAIIAVTGIIIVFIAMLFFLLS